jgi:D-3-phosphoglycerate dehydrogenase
MKVKVLHPVENIHLRLLLLENISQDAVAAFRAQGFDVDHHTKAMSEDELVAALPAYHAIGIRSKTKITARVIKAATKVSAVLTPSSLSSSSPASSCSSLVASALAQIR